MIQRKIDADELERMLFVENRGVRECARHFKVAPSSITKARQKLEKAKSQQEGKTPSQPNAQGMTVARATKKLARKIDLLEEIAGDHGKLAEGLRYVERRMDSADDQLRPILEARFLRFLEVKGKTEDRYLETGRVFLSLIAHEEFRRIVIQEIKRESPECAARISRRIESLLLAQGLG